MTTYPIRARIRAEAGQPVRVDVMDDIGADPWFGGGIGAADFAGQLAGIREPLDVHISSAGGVVSDGLAIYNALLQHPGDVTTFVDGYAASIASVIMQAGKRRVVADASAVMIHDPWGLAEGNQADMLRMAAALGTNADVIAGAYAARAGGTVEQWRQAMQAEKWYTPDEAVAAGLADEVAGSPARLPRGLDLEALAARAPARIVARLRNAAPAAPDGDEGGSDAPPCKTCKGKGRLPHPGTGKNGKTCPECNGSGTYDPDSADDDDSGDGEGDDEGMRDRLRNAAGRPYEPQPYKRTSDENVQCPACQKFSDDDARYCGQCGTQLTGRTDVREAPLAPAASAGTDAAALRALVHAELVAASLIPGPDGYFRPVGAAGVDNSAWDSAKAWHNGTQADDPEAFYRGICAGHHTAGDPKAQAYWALPYRYHPDDPPNAGGVRAAWGVLNGSMGGVDDLADRDAVVAKVKGLMKQVSPDWEPDDSTSTFTADAVKQFRAAMSALRGARA